MTPEGELVTWESWFPPDLSPDHAPFFEYVTDQDGQEWCFWYDPREAFRWVNFAPEYCTFIEGEPELVGQPLHLLDYQLGPTREMFGWKVVRDGQLTDYRRYKSAHIWMPKGNSKTTWGSTLDLAACKLDARQQAQCFYMCATLDQADDSGWRILQAMCNAEEGRLRGEYTAWDEHIHHGPTDSSLHLVASNGEGKAGKNLQFAHCDEIWEFPTLKAMTQLRTAAIKQKNAFILCTSTAGTDVTKPAYKLYQTDVAILKGELKDVRHLPVIYGAPEGSDPHDPKVWEAANPGWGITVDPDTFQRLYQTMRVDPIEFSDFMAFNLGLWQSGSQEFITDAQWALARRNYSYDQLYGRFWCMAKDLADIIDMCSSAACVPVRASFCCPISEYPNVNQDDVHYLLANWFWVGEIVDREKFANAERYERWIAENLLTRASGPGGAVDYDAIRDHVKVCAKRAREIYQIGFDRRFAHKCLYQLRDEPNNPDDPDHRIWKDDPPDHNPPRLIEINQQEAGMGNALKDFRHGILLQTVHHNGHPILDWNRGNARVVKKASGLHLLDKGKSTGKIDGLHAATMAYYLAQRMGLRDEPEDPFAERGLFIL